jgi:hypothetical protein
MHQRYEKSPATTIEGRDIETQREIDNGATEPVNRYATRLTMATERVDRSTRTDNGAMEGQSV